MQTGIVILIGTLLAAIVAAQPARSESLRDDATGLTIAPPEGYIATQMTPAPAGTFPARFSVKKPSDRDTGCQVAFTPLPQNAGLTQDEINHVMATSQWLDLARASIALNYDVLDTAPFAHGDIRGVALVGLIKQRPYIFRCVPRKSVRFSSFSKPPRAARQRSVSARKRTSRPAGPSSKR
jgi:hypothetical protein